MKVFTLLCLFFAASEAAYPTYYPYDNELDDNVPPPLPASTPTADSADAENPGGYIYTKAVAVNLDERDWTVQDYCPTLDGLMQYLMETAFGIPQSDFTTPVFNCTTKYVVGEEHFLGVSSPTLDAPCEEGECCRKHIGIISTTTGDRIVQQHEEWKDVLEGGGCSENPVEDMYCVYVAGDFHWNCIEQFQSPMDRLVVIPCPQVYFLFAERSCPIYAATGMLPPPIEPEVYITPLTVQEKSHLTMSWRLPDKVCHPQSYYFPEEAADLSSTTSSTTSLTTTSTASIPSGSSGSHDSESSDAARVALAFVFGLFLY